MIMRVPDGTVCCQLVSRSFIYQLGGGRGEGTEAVWLFDALVNYYIESKSKRTLLILSGIRNTYADYLLQRYWSMNK